MKSGTNKRNCIDLATDNFHLAVCWSAPALCVSSSASRCSHFVPLWHLVPHLCTHTGTCCSHVLSRCITTHIAFISRLCCSCHTETVCLMASGVQAEINTWVVLSVALPGMTSDPTVMLPAASVGMLLAIGTAGLTVSSPSSLPCTRHTRQAFWVLHAFSTAQAPSKCRT